MATALLSYPLALTRHDLRIAIFASSPNTRLRSSSRTSNSYSSRPIVYHGHFFRRSQKLASGTANTRILSIKHSETTLLYYISSFYSFCSLMNLGLTASSYIYLKSLCAYSNNYYTVWVSGTMVRNRKIPMTSICRRIVMAWKIGIQMITLLIVKSWVNMIKKDSCTTPRQCR